MRPMILKDIAEAVTMHESTISRVTSGKYMHTPRGVFELRYFFSSQVEAADGSGTSSTAIRAKIRKLVKDEDQEAPLSDGRIAELLSACYMSAQFGSELGIVVQPEALATGKWQPGPTAPATPREAGPLQVDVGTPMLVVSRDNFDSYGTPVELGRTWFRGDRVTLVTRLASREA